MFRQHPRRAAQLIRDEPLESRMGAIDLTAQRIEFRSELLLTLKIYFGRSSRYEALLLPGQQSQPGGLFDPLDAVLMQAPSHGFHPAGADDRGRHDQSKSERGQRDQQMDP